MNKDDLLKVLGIIVLGAVAVYISRYIFLPSLVFNLPFIFIFALIFFPIARAKYNREKMDYSITGLGGLCLKAMTLNVPEVHLAVFDKFSTLDRVK